MWFFDKLVGLSGNFVPHILRTLANLINKTILCFHFFFFQNICVCFFRRIQPRHSTNIDMGIWPSVLTTRMVRTFKIFAATVWNLFLFFRSIEFEKSEYWTDRKVSTTKTSLQILRKFTAKVPTHSSTIYPELFLLLGQVG